MDSACGSASANPHAVVASPTFSKNSRNSSAKPRHAAMCRLRSACASWIGCCRDPCSRPRTIVRIEQAMREGGPMREARRRHFGAHRLGGLHRLVRLRVVSHQPALRRHAREGMVEKNVYCSQEHRIRRLHFAAQVVAQHRGRNRQALGERRFTAEDAKRALQAPERCQRWRTAAKTGTRYGTCGVSVV